MGLVSSPDANHAANVLALLEEELLVLRGTACAPVLCACVLTGALHSHTHLPQIRSHVEVEDKERIRTGKENPSIAIRALAVWLAVWHHTVGCIIHGGAV